MRSVGLRAQSVVYSRLRQRLGPLHGACPPLPHEPAPPRAAPGHAKTPDLASDSHANPLFRTLTRYSAGRQACPRSN